MAKSKLSIQLHQAFSNVKTDLAHIKKTLESDHPLTREQFEHFGNQWDALARASSAMSRHLVELERRETSPSVPDRLRNLKNVFKNKQELAQQRAVTRQWYKNLDAKISQLWAKSQKKIREAGDIVEVRSLSAEVNAMETGVAGFDQKVDALEAVLQ
jgi:hypothetical protein